METIAEAGRLTIGQPLGSVRLEVLSPVQDDLHVTVPGKHAGQDQAGFGPR